MVLYSKCQFLARPDVLTLPLEYTDLFSLSDNSKQTFGRGYPALYHSILLYLSIAIVTTSANFAQICSSYASSLLLPAYYSNDFASKINASLNTSTFNKLLHT